MEEVANSAGSCRVGKFHKLLKAIIEVVHPLQVRILPTAQNVGIGKWLAIGLQNLLRRFDPVCLLFKIYYETYSFSNITYTYNNWLRNYLPN